MIKVFIGTFLIVIGSIIAISVPLFFKEYINDDEKTMGITLMGGAIVILGCVFMAQHYYIKNKREF
jgi:Na+/melibiose symporter-like transporter